MLNITNAASLTRVLASPIDPGLRHLLIVRNDQLLSDTRAEYELSDLVQFIVVEPDDKIADVEAAAGYPFVTCPAFEWVADHDGWYEAPTILSDDGFAVVLLVPDKTGVDPTLLLLMREQAGPINQASTHAGSTTFR